MVAVASAQILSTEEQAPDSLQMYQLLDDKADQIFRVAQDLGAAIDALRAGRSRDFLKNSMRGFVAEDSVPRATMPQADAPMLPIGASFGKFFHKPLIQSFVILYIFYLNQFLYIVNQYFSWTS